MKAHDIIAGSKAKQDQEIAAAADWVDECDVGALIKFYNAINDGEPEDFRKMSDEYLHVVRSLAMIGIFEAAHSNASRTA